MTTNSFSSCNNDTVALAPRRLSQQIVPVRRKANSVVKPREESQNPSATDLLKRQLADMTTELLSADQRLLASHLEQQELTDAMSHDLRAPLRAIAGFSKYLKEEFEGKLDETADSYINYIVDGATRMEHLIQGMVQYSRIKSKALKNDVIDLNDLLADALAASENLSIDVDSLIADGDLPKVCGDYDQLNLLLKNLIDNGLKFNDSASPSVQIRIQRVSDDLRISVCDNGVGIAEQNLECAFDLFRRLNVRGKFAGEGAGLAICRRIAEHHSGKLWLESEEGVGTTAILSLPSA